MKIKDPSRAGLDSVNTSLRPCTAHYTLHTTHCKLPTALHTAHYTLCYAALCTDHTTHAEHFKLHSAQFTLHTEHCTLQHTALTGAYLAPLRYLHAPPHRHICKHCHCRASGPQGPLGMPPRGQKAACVCATQCSTVCSAVSCSVVDYTVQCSRV